MMPIPKVLCLALLTSLAWAAAAAPKAAATRAADNVSNDIDQLAGESLQAMQFAQVELQIPSAAQLDRMEREDIATPPLDVSGSPIPKGSEQSQIRRMDRQDRIIDDKVMRGICSDC
jgi:hypothetical protein